MTTWNSLNFPDSASPTMEQMIFFHDHALTILILITLLVSYLMMAALNNSYSNRYLLEGQEVETFWTLVPALMLIFIALPSLKLLYLMEEVQDPTLTMKAIGHQWYWSYEFTEFQNKLSNHSSYMTKENKPHIFRLLDVNHRITLPWNSTIRVIITSTDVIHSWALPAMGIKVDAVPGRLNQTFLHTHRMGLFFGQCSEICGANHSFMPIAIQVVPLSKWNPNNGATEITPL